MKHLLTILCVLTSFTALAQFPNVHPQSNPYTKEVFNGSVNPKKGLINGRYADTAAANLDYVAGEAGAQIVVGNTIYLRDSTATKWIVAGGYGVIASNITILNDSSISICNGITCDTFSFTNIVVNNFSVVNDSTILVCDGNNVCDTLFIPPTPISKNFVDSAKIIDGVIYYYINGNAYSGGAVTGTSQYQWSVLDSVNNIVSPQQGDVYLVSTSPTGAFVGHENQIAQYDTTAGFTFTSPNIGDLLYNSTTYQVSKWTGTAWVLQPPPLVENWWSRVAWNGAPGQYIQTGAKNSYLTMFGSLNGTNTGLGRQVFTDNPTGGDGGNTAIGSTSQFHIRAGAYNNTSVGNYSLWYHVSGHDQVAIGYNAASTGDKIFSIGLGTNAPNNNNTFSISDSTTHLYMKLDSASGVAPSVIGKDANGNWHTYQTPSGSSGSGNTKYLLQGYGTKIDSAGANYTVAVDSAAFKDSLYVGRGIKADITTYPNHALLTVDSNYVRDTSLHLAGGTINQVLKKNSSTNGDWSWQDESGGGGAGCDSCISTITLSGDSVVYFIRQDGDTAKALAWSGGTAGLLSLTGHAPIIVDNSDPLNPIVKADTTTAITGLATQADLAPISLKLNSSDTTNKWVQVVQAKNDSTITVIKNGVSTDIIIKGNAAALINQDSAYIQITSNIGGTTPPSAIKGLRLQNTRTDLTTSNINNQAAPPIIWKAFRWNGSSVVPYWVRIYASCVSTNTGAGLYYQYSSDSTNWSAGVSMEVSGGNMTVPGTLTAPAITSSYISNNSTYVIRPEGRVTLGTNAAPNNSIRLQLLDTAAGFIVNRMSTNARNLLGGPNSITLISGGSGYNATNYPTTTTGYGTGLVITTAVSGGVVTSGTIGSTARGQNYRLGDTVTISGAGSGTASFVISALQGDLAPGLMVNDTTLNKIMVWNHHLHGWVSPSGYSGRYSFSASSTSTFTVTIGGSLPYLDYSVNIEPTSSLAAAPFYITNKTATTFDVVYLSPLTGTVTFDWSVTQ